MKTINLDMRPKVLEKAIHELIYSQEEFITALPLGKHIEEVLSVYGKPTKPNSYILDMGCGFQPYATLFYQFGYINHET
jgi:hypothetical protein